MPDPIAQLRNALADRYTIERELGRGATAIVYLARDLRHGRQVALKVLNPELALAVRSERFLREIQIAAQLNHPHILPLHDSGDASGTLFYVMPYVAGESLRDRLTREKQLPLEDALRIARDVAAALTAAHAAGVVHRDIKPENILLNRTGEAVVADFGIARALTVAVGQGVTEGGIAVGTPAYMSPEQAAGSDRVDERSDLYSLGCVLYEMLAGHPPFLGSTAQETLARHAMDPVPALSAARRGMRRGIERTVARALAKEPADRFRTATQFVEALGAGASESWRPSRPAAYAALVAVVLLGGVGVVSRRLNRAPPASELSVAVLPCRNLSTDPENEYFSDGLTEELIDELTQIEGLRVPASTSSFWFKGKIPEIREVGRKLDVAHVIDCSARKVGNVVRVSAQLIKVSDGFHLWSQQYEREFRSNNDVFAIQDSVARAVVTVLRLRLAPRPLLAGRRAVDPAAHDLYLKGRFFLRKGTPQGNAKAIEQFRAAIARDSSYALAYSGLAEAYYNARLRGYLPRPQATQQLKVAASKAMILDSTLAEVHNALARSYQADWDMTAASRASQRAIILNPDYVLGHITYAIVLTNLGRMDEAVREVRIGTRLDPLAVESITGNVLTRAHLYDEAIAEFRRNLELEPDASMRADFGRALVNAGRFKEAIPEILRSFELRPGVFLPPETGWLAYAYARVDRREDALKLFRELEDRLKQSSTGGFTVPHGLAYACLGVGRPDCALQAIEQAVEAGTGNFGWWLYPVFDSLRSHPRYQRAMQRATIHFTDFHESASR